MTIPVLLFAIKEKNSSLMKQVSAGTGQGIYVGLPGGVYVLVLYRIGRINFSEFCRMNDAERTNTNLYRPRFKSE